MKQSGQREIATQGWEKKRTVHGVDVLLEDTLVPLSLHLGHADVDVDFLLGQERVLDVGLDSSQQERSENLVELLDDLVLVSVATTREPGVEVLRGREDVCR